MFHPSHFIFWDSELQERLHVEILLLVSENTLPNVLPVGTNLYRPKNWNIGFGDESAGLSNCRGDLAQAKIFILKKFHKVSPFPK